jgi:LPS-assembly protein
VRRIGSACSPFRPALRPAFRAALAGALELAPTPGLGAELHLQSATAPAEAAAAANDGQMLVQAVEVDYDYNNQRVSAVGNVQMFYNGTSVEADKVIYDQKTKRLHAEGNIRMTDADGKITYANIMDLSDDYRDGSSIRCASTPPTQTRMAATRADRSSGNYTVFENGVYTACAPCKDDPKKPPLWQVKGARIIHDQTEKMLYFENAQLEFFGVPMAYLPYFSTPDPTVKRKTGFLMPGFSTVDHATASASKRRSTGRSLPTTTRPSVRASRPGRACCSRANSASA